MPARSLPCRVAHIRLRQTVGESCDVATPSRQGLRRVSVCVTRVLEPLRRLLWEPAVETNEWSDQVRSRHPTVNATAPSRRSQERGAVPPEPRYISSRCYTVASALLGWPAGWPSLVDSVRPIASDHSTPSFSPSKAGRLDMHWLAREALGHARRCRKRGEPVQHPFQRPPRDRKASGVATQRLRHWKQSMSCPKKFVPRQARNFTMTCPGTSSCTSRYVTRMS